MRAIVTCVARSVVTSRSKQPSENSLSTWSSSSSFSSVSKKIPFRSVELYSLLNRWFSEVYRPLEDVGFQATPKLSSGHGGRDLLAACLPFCCRLFAVTMNETKPSTSRLRFWPPDWTQTSVLLTKTENKTNIFDNLYSPCSVIENRWR